MRDLEQYVKTYERSDFEVNVQVRYRRKFVVEIIERFSPDSILEIGCGIEPIFKYIDMRKMSKVTIMEPAAKFAGDARQCADKMQLEDKVRVIGKTLETGYKDLSDDHDMILCSGLLHEVDDPAKLLTCIRSICNKNTIVHINVPNAYSLHRLLAYEMGIIGDVHELSKNNLQFQQYSVFDMEMLCDVMVENGFTILDKGSYFCKPFAHQQMSKMQEVNILNEQILDGLDRLVKYMPEYGSEIYVNAKI